MSFRRIAAAVPSRQPAITLIWHVAPVASHEPLWIEANGDLFAPMPRPY
jgi:hypothetical protein